MPLLPGDCSLLPLPAAILHVGEHKAAGKKPCLSVQVLFLIIHNGLCVFVPHQGARSRKSTQVICIHFDGIEDIDV